MKVYKSYYVFYIFLFVLSCSNENNVKQEDSTKHTNFVLKKNTHVDFSNDLTEDVDQNYLNFEYILQWWVNGRRFVFLRI